MRVDYNKRPLLYPQPVIMIGTYDENGNPDIMNAAWGGVGDDHQIFLCLSPEHKTVKNMLLKKAFTVSIATEDTVKACDYLGIASGNNTPDKVQKSGLHVVKASNVDAPMIEELPICIECKLISYEPEHCHCFGEIVASSVDESVLTNGKIDVKKLKPIIYDIDNHDYYGFGSAVGKAFSDGLELK